MKFNVVKIAALAAVVFLPSSPSDAQQVGDSVTIKTITLLHTSEAYQAHTYTADALWVGKSKQTEGDSHRIEVYVDQGSRLLGTVNLPHTPSFAYPYGTNSVLVVGKSFSDEWRTHYSIISKTGDTLTLKTKNLPAQYQVEQGAANSQFKFFSEKGEARVLVEANNRAVRALSPVISGPAQMQLVGDNLFVIESRNSGLGDENIVKIDLKNESAERTFTDYYRQGITEIRHIPGTNMLAANEALTGKVLLIDESTNKLVSQLDVVRDIRALETLGHCLIASAAEDRKLSFIDVRDAAVPVVIDTWDLSPAGETLRRPNSLAVDAKTGTIYVRSTWTCPTCAPNTQSSVVALTQASRKTINRCLAD